MFVAGEEAPRAEWPFRSVSPSAYWALKEYDRGVIEGFVRGVAASSEVEKRKAG